MPKVESVIIKYVSDTTARLASLVAGEADIVEGLGPDEAKHLAGNPNVTVQHTTSTDSINLAFRTQTPPMNNVKLRQAIAYAINVPAIVNRIYGGYAVVNHMFGQPDTYGFFDDPNYFHYDLARAKRLLSEAGYPGGKGLRTLTFITPIGAYPKTLEISEFIVQNLANIGIKVHLQTMDETAWADALFKPEGDMILHGWLVPTPDRNAWYTSLFRSKGLISFISNSAIDNAIKAQEQALNRAARDSIIRSQLEPALVREVPEFPMYTYDLITGVSKKIHGLLIPHWYEFDMFPVSKS
jgi:peptide/nickel transport system substrate-binding protein